MPRERSNVPAPQEPEATGTSLQVPDDVLGDLLAAQRESIELPQALPQIKIMGGGVTLFEFADVSETKQSFKGVILNTHSRNVLWDKAFGQEPATEEERFPACSSPDGKYGTPRQGFNHEALDRRANGDELIECKTCPYNKFGSGAKLISNKNPKGKAVTNQRSVYIVVEDRNAPMELVIPPTSMAALDEYMTTLLNRRLPALGVVTEFSLIRKEKGSLRWSVVTFKHDRNLNQAEFTDIMAMREEYRTSIFPPDITPASRTGLAGIPLEDSEFEQGGTDYQNEEDLPF